MMKNYAYFGLIVLLLFAACAEQEPIDNPIIEPSLSEVDNKTVSFSSREDFEILFSDPNYLKEKTKRLNHFNSLMSFIPSEFEEEFNARSLCNPSDSIYADYGILPEILNEDKIVKIGNYLIKIDLHNERVLVLPYSFKSEYNDLVSGNMTNENIMVFSTYDEVLTLLDNGSNGTINGKTEACDEPGARGQTIEAFPSSRRKRRLKAAVGYQASGIYFSIVSKGKAQKKIGAWVRNGKTGVNQFYQISFALRCGFQFAESGFEGSNKGKSSFRPYSGLKALICYNIRSEFSSANGNVT